MKHLLHSLALRVTMLIALLVSFGSSGAWATAYISYLGNTQQASTTITSSNVSSGTVGVISWTGTSCTYSSSRVNIAANGSITFTASSGYNITKIVITSGSTSSYYGTWTSSPSVTPSSSSGVTTFDGLSANSVTVTTSTAFRCTSASDIKIYYQSAASTKDVGAFSVISDQEVTKGGNISFNPASYFTPDEDLTADATLTITPTTGDIYYSDGKIYATNYGSQEFTVTATPAVADADNYDAVETTFTVNCEDTRTATTTAINTSAINNNVFVGTDGGSVTATVTPEGGVALVTPTILWSSSNTSVATIDETTGAIILVAAGSTTITATYSGDASYKPSSDTYELTVVSVDPTIRTVWSEDFSDYTENDQPSGGTYSYSYTNGGGTTQVYNNNNAGGTKPEILVAKRSGTFSATIPLNGLYTGNMTLSFKSNAYDISVSTTTTGVSISGTSSFNTLGTHNVTFTGITTSTNSLVVTFTGPSGDKNVRLDDIVLKGKPAPTAPSFSPAEGDILKGNTVTLTADEGCTIYYTTDGTTPTDASTEYTGAITINAAQTIKAIAVDANDVSSKVVSATYTLLKPEMPEFSVAAKTYDTAFDMTISSASGTTLKYTTDGTDPSSSGAATAVASNSTTINIPTGADVTVKAIAILDGVESNVAEVTYDYDDRPAPTFTLSDDELNIKVNEASSVTLTTTSDGTVTAASSDGIHLPVSYNSSTKVCSFTPSLAGDYTITISVPATENYLAAEATVDVHVTKKPTTMDLATSFTSKDLYVTTSGSVTGTPKYNSSAIDGAEVTYTSSNTSVATVAADGTVTYKKAGSTTITASYEGDAEYEECEASYELDLVDTTPQETEVTLNFNNSLYGTSYTGTNAANNGPFDGTTKGVTVTVTQGSGTNLYINNSETRIYGGTTKGNIKIDAPTGYVMTNIAFTAGTWDISSVSTGSLNSKTWTGNASSMTIYANTRSDFQSAVVTLAETVTIGDAGYTTYVAKHDISFPVDVTAYIATATSSSTVTLTSKASVPEGTAVVVKGEAGTYALPTIKTDPESVTGNLLQASDGNVEGNGSIYALAKKNGEVGFYLVKSGVSVPAGKAYLDLSGSGVKEFLGFNFDTETGITETAEKAEVTESLFDLSGRRVSKAQKGLYIVNGKKVLVK